MKRSRLPKNPAFILLALLFSLVVSPLSAQDNDGIITLFTEDFESGFGQWYADNGVWEIGIPTSGPDSAGSSGQVAGTILNGSYPRETQTRLISPDIKLPDTLGLRGKNLRFSFRQWRSLNNRDQGIVEISTDGIDWEPVPGIGLISGISQGWESVLAPDLSAYAGQTVKIAFSFEATDSEVSHGWYVDDVRVYTQPTTPPGGTETFASPIDWEIEGGVWQFGIPRGGAMPQHAADGVAATVLNGAYPGPGSPRLISPSYFIPDSLSAQQLKIRFHHHFDFASEDSGAVQISVNERVWQSVGNAFKGNSGGWTRYVLSDLSDFVSAEDEVRFAFQLSAQNDRSNRSGWMVDEFTISMDETVSFDPFSNGMTASIGPEDPGSGLEWFSDNGVWETGLPTSGPGAPHSGSMVAATQLGGAYPNGASSRFVSPPLEIRNSEFSLQFWYWFDFSPGDQGSVQASVNNGDWIDISNRPFTNSSGVWSQYRVPNVVVALKNRVGAADLENATIRLGFLFTSRSSGTTRAGWYVDDIVITQIAPVIIDNESIELPLEVDLEQNYPNPFSAGTTIAFTLGAPEPVTLKIYDVLGREVATLLDDVILSGKNTLIWNGGGQSSGIYLYRLQTSAMVLTRRMHLVK